MPNCDRVAGRICRFLTASMMTLAIAGCSHHDNFPMRNAVTGQEVTCRSGDYGLEEGAPQMRIASQCFAACARYGFQRQMGNPYADKVQGRVPDDDVKQYMPAACLP